VHYQPISIGQRFGRLVVIAEVEHHLRWRVRCDCGVEKNVLHTSLNRDNTRSCGCLHRDQMSARNKKHGQSGATKTVEYRAWLHATQRCYNPKDRKFPSHGGRGITVCERWRTSFTAFFEDMGLRPPDKTSIDRIDNDLGYWCGKPECVECGPLGRSPNCRWATAKEQARNTRRNRFLVAFGRRMMIEEWAAEKGMNYRTLTTRLASGLEAEEALSRPIRKW